MRALALAARTLDTPPAVCAAADVGLSAAMFTMEISLETDRTAALWNAAMQQGAKPTVGLGPTSHLDQLPEAMLPTVPLLEGGDELFMCGKAAVIVDGPIA